MNERLNLFMEKVTPVTESGCWLWEGVCRDDGYGQFWDGKSMVGAHRWLYITLHGHTDLSLDHLCRVRCCVNPDHLEPVTKAENTRRGNTWAMGTHERNKTHCPRGHEYSTNNTTIYKGSRFCKTCNRLKSRRQYYNKISQ